MFYRLAGPLLLILQWTIVPPSYSQCPCPPLTGPSGDVIDVQNVSQLNAALSQANINNGNTTIMLHPGTYRLTENLLFISSNMKNLTIRGSSGNRDDVKILGQGWNDNSVTHIVNVQADSFTLADVTIGEVFYHPIQIHSNDEDADDCLIQNVRILDAKEQLLKVSGGGSKYADRGRVLCCLFEFTGGIAYQYYTGGIDAHRSKDWNIKYNVFKHIRSPESNLAEHAIHFWRESEDNLVEGNIIINCDRGIGFGLGDEVPDGHQGGLIMNNFVHTSRDVGIGLESAPDAKVYNNTVVTDNYNRSIEYRFATTTGVHIANNLTTQSISDRSSGSSGTIESNYVGVDTSIFFRAQSYDYHLIGVETGVTDSGIALPEVTQDIDCNSRIIGTGMDIGADEYAPTTPTDVLLLLENITLHPNPTPNTFKITGSLDHFDILVLDALGNKYLEFVQIAGSIEIDLSGLPAGMYFVLISSKYNPSCTLRKIIKTL